MRIARAMLKRREYWPAWMSCCEEAVKIMTLPEFYEDVFEVDLGDIDTMEQGEIRCLFCQTVYPATKVVRRIRDNRWAPIDILDIDEGAAA